MNNWFTKTYANGKYFNDIFLADTIKLIQLGEGRSETD